MQIPAHVKYIVLSVLFVLASFNFIRTTLEIIENSKRLDSLSQEVNDLEHEKEELEKSVAFKVTDEYVEEKARNDLNLIRPGEKVYVIPKELKSADLESRVLGEKSGVKSSFLANLDPESNVTKWVLLFAE